MIKRLTSIVVIGEEAAQKAVSFMVEHSQWFEFDPMPDGYYEFRVKTEAADRLTCEISPQSLAWVTPLFQQTRETLLT